jgi:hypothetical protein
MVLTETLLTSNVRNLITTDVMYNSGATAPGPPVGPYTNFLSTNPGYNLSYYNTNPLTFALNSTSTGENYIRYQLTNAKSTQSALLRYYPASLSLAYVGTVPNETDIPLNQNFTSNLLISSQRRMSLSSSATPPPSGNPSGANIVSYNPQSLTKYDLSYNPMNSLLYSTTSGLRFALSSFFLPNGLPTLNDSGGNPANRYNLVRLTTTGRMETFTINLGTNTNCVSNIYVRWGETGQDSRGWADASVSYLSGSPFGCRAASQSGGTSPYFEVWPIRGPAYSWSSSDPYVYILMECNTVNSGGTIPFTSFVVQ